MDSKHLLAEVRAQIAAGTLSRKDVERVLEDASHTPDAPGWTLHFSGATLLYALGGLILLTGVLFLIAQVWEEIGSFGRVALTLGLGFVSLIAAVLAEKGAKHAGDLLPSILFGIGGVLVTPGVFIFLDELGSDVDSLWVPTAVFAMLAAMYALLRYTFTSVVLTFFTIAHVTAFLYACTAASTEGLDDTSTIFELLTMLIGGAYLMLARTVTHRHDALLVRPLVAFGTLGILGALFALMTEYSGLEIVYPFAVLAVYYLGVIWQRRTMLILGSLFFIGYISYITAQYFADSIGWPLALIFLGAIFLGLGYVTLQMSKKFEK